MQHKPLDQQVIVITGASSGIGLCTALLAAERGATVVLLARSAQTLHTIVQAITEDGGKAQAIVCDVADREQLFLAADEVRLTYGRIDTWVNNAGVAIYGRLEEVPDADSRRLFDVNFWGTVNGSLAALPALADRFAARQASRQERAAPPRDPEGTLVRPGESGRVYGVDEDGDVLA